MESPTPLEPPGATPNTTPDTFHLAAAPAPSRWARRLASPLGVMLTIPALVIGIGGFIALVGDWSLKASTNQLADARFSDQSQHVTRQTQDMLRQAAPLLDRWQRFLRSYKGKEPTRPIAVNHLLDLMTQRPGVSYISHSRQRDGLFLGLFRFKPGELRYAIRRIKPDGKTLMQDFRVAHNGKLTLVRSHQDYKYDVRTRGFYKTAKAAGKRTWTQPYTFYDSGLPGISFTDVSRDAKGAFTGVSTVDFDLNSLSREVERLKKSTGGSAFLFTKGKVLLAYPGVYQPAGVNKRGKAKLLTVKSYKDPLLKDFFQSAPSLHTTGYDLNKFRFTHDGKLYLGSVVRCRLNQDLNWYVGVMAPRESFVGLARSYRKTTLRIVMVGLVFALLLSWGFALHLVRTRRAVKAARQAAKQAEKKAQELGSYTLLQPIGKGSMGEVWKGRHKMLSRPAAIKLVRPELLSFKKEKEREQALKQFEREARVTSLLSSPHTVRLYDFGLSEDGTLFYVMELLEGIDLRTLVKEHGPQPLGRVIPILSQVCASLSEAHQYGLVHRDLKPANIFLCAQGDQLDAAKVLDFGVVWSSVEQEQPALDESDHTRGKLKLMGTPSCMATEQIHQKTQPDGRTDIYALGCLGFWLLTGRRVFETKTVVNMLTAHLEQTPEPVSTYSPSPLPPEIDMLLLRCLDKEPDKRPKDAQTLRRMLQSIELPQKQEWSETMCEQWWDEHIPLASRKRMASLAHRQEQGFDTVPKAQAFSGYTPEYLEEEALLHGAPTTRSEPPSAGMSWSMEQEDDKQTERLLVPKSHRTLFG